MAPQNALRSSFGGWDAKQAYMFLLRARKVPVPGELSFPPAARSEASSKYTDHERLALRPAATGKSSRPARSQWRRPVPHDGTPSDYNTVRPHGSLGNLTPAAYANRSAPDTQRDGGAALHRGSAPRPVASPSQMSSNQPRTLPIAG